MTVNLLATLKDYENNDVTYSEIGADGKEVAGKPLTVRVAFIKALNTVVANEALTPEQKARIYMLSVLLYSGDQADLRAEDIVFIKERTGKVWNALVYGKVCELLDNPSVVPAPPVAN